MAIVEQGFLVGGGPDVESGKAHNYFSDKPLEDIRYKSGVRACAKFELVVDTEIAMYFGALFVRTVSDGILTVDHVHPRAVLGIRDTTTDEAVWSAEATELIKLGKDMIIASPESYLCFVEPPPGDPKESINKPPAKVAKTASMGAGGNKDSPGRHLAFPQASKDSASSACDIFGVLVNGSSDTQSRVAANPQRCEEDGRKGLSNAGRPEYP